MRRRGELNVVSGARKESLPDGAFQLFDTRTHRRLSQAEIVGGLAEMPSAPYFEKRPQKLCIHGSS
jgi:hypothetical protein